MSDHVFRRELMHAPAHVYVLGRLTTAIGLVFTFTLSTRHQHLFYTSTPILGSSYFYVAFIVLLFPSLLSFVPSNITNLPPSAFVFLSTLSPS